MSSRVVIIMGSGSDEGFADPIVKTLESLGVEVERRVASAHKTPKKLLQIIEEYRDKSPLVYITVAGLSNSLSGFVDANSVHPVIACPPTGEKFEVADIFSSLRMPKGVSPLVVLQPENAALGAAKILAITDSALYKRLEILQRETRLRIEKDDEKVRQ
jgi:phosphoribosylaminoimidazole carboxylase PurE protein